MNRAFLAWVPLATACMVLAACRTDTGVRTTAEAGTPRTTAEAGTPARDVVLEGGAAEPDASEEGSTASSGSRLVLDGGITNPGLGACSVPGEAASRSIVFDSTRGTYDRDIYVARADGSRLVRVTADPFTEQEPSISSDGRSLVFASDRSGTMQIHLMDLESGALKQLTSPSILSGVPLACAGATGCSADGGLGSAPGTADQPSFSPDGTLIAFHSGYAIYVMNADGTNIRGFVSPDGYGTAAHPVLTPDNTQLVFDEYNAIVAATLDGMTFRYVTLAASTTVETPSVSPDGVNVAFASLCVSGLESIAVTPLAGMVEVCPAELVTPPSVQSARRPAWGPAGVIAFERSSMPSPNVAASIALSTAAGEPTCDLVGAPGDNRNPSWAPATFQVQ